MENPDKETVNAFQDLLKEKLIVSIFFTFRVRVEKQLGKLSGDVSNAKLVITDGVNRYD